ncbi:MAG TPA: MBL fold metallo-hydrolase [Kiritimatiellia bacterium]|nr:MBL fold metallo-hydrolase [Kiritimatiellia bacterium]
MKITPLIANYFTSDGGAMFGFVPKPIWSKRMAADEQNRIPQHAHSLLVELKDGRKGLIDTGCGPEDRFSEKEIERNGLGPGWPLMDALARSGTDAEEIAFVVVTHLHWDHGGGLVGGTSEDLTCAFPKAKVFVHGWEWKDARTSPAVLYRSYPRELIGAIEAGYGARVTTVEKDEAEVMPGVTMIRTGGHTRGHCMIRLEDEGIELNHPDAIFFFPPREAVFAGDVCPMHHNLRMVYQTAYDTFPLETREWKLSWLPKLAASGGLLFFDHDPELFGATVTADEKTEFRPVKLVRTEFSPFYAGKRTVEEPAAVEA